MKPIVKVINPPERIRVDIKVNRLFLAGSIEMGKAEDWQSRVINDISLWELKDEVEITIFNPRRKNWDASWQQTFESPHFFQQVNWELNSLDHCTHILFYFDPATISPVSMLELGLHIRDNLYVVCPKGFYRKGNIDIVCERYGIKQYDTLNDAIGEIMQDMERFAKK